MSEWEQKRSRVRYTHYFMQRFSQLHKGRDMFSLRHDDASHCWPIMAATSLSELRMGLVNLDTCQI